MLWSSPAPSADIDTMTGTGDRLFTSAFIALAASDLVYFTASGLLIGVTPFFVT
jgi:hypothetical protein